MSGLFLNYYQIDLSKDEITITYLNQLYYKSKEEYEKLKSENPDLSFYRFDNKIFFWSYGNSQNTHLASESHKILSNDNPRLFSKIIENSFINFIEQTLVPNGYRIRRNRYSLSWKIISHKDLLEGNIKGLNLFRVVHLSPYYIKKDGRLIFGFTISTSLKNEFTWSIGDFERNGIDTKGLNGKDNLIYSSKQAIKRFLESTGCLDIYNRVVTKENQRTESFVIIDKFYHWLNSNKKNIKFPFNIQAISITKKYLPFENDLIRSEIIYKPQRYFYSNKRNTQGLKFYDQMVKAYKPYSLELYQNKNMEFGVICPKEYQGETEAFLKKIELKLKEIFHFNYINFNLITTNGNKLNNYQDVLYDERLLKSDLVYIIVSEHHEKLNPKESPYYVCKAKLIGNGIPTQNIQIETIRQKLSLPVMANISLNSYAKIGGTAWTIEKEERLREELVIGIGSTIGENGQHVLGIAQIFHNDGRYILGDCAPLSTFENYSENLENHLYATLKPLVSDMNQSESFRLTFHLYKSASEKYEILAINNLKNRFSEYNFEFALVHLGYGHNFRFYYNDGKLDVMPGTYVQLNSHSALLHFVKNSDLPLKIDLDKRSTFTSLFYIAKQIYWFSHLSHRSYIPAKKTVTIMYPSLMAKLTEELKKVEGWDYARLKAVSEKLWFI